MMFEPRTDCFKSSSKSRQFFIVENTTVRTGGLCGIEPVARKMTVRMMVGISISRLRAAGMVPQV
jgi:hypothetical protein